MSLLCCTTFDSRRIINMVSTVPRLKQKLHWATLGLVQIGPHHPAHPVHEQHGVNLARNVEEVNPSIIVYGLLQALAVIKGHHQGLLPSHQRPTHKPNRQKNLVRPLNAFRASLEQGGNNAILTWCSNITKTLHTCLHLCKCRLFPQPLCHPLMLITPFRHSSRQRPTIPAPH